jgi:hypothetical protein
MRHWTQEERLKQAQERHGNEPQWISFLFYPCSPYDNINKMIGVINMYRPISVKAIWDSEAKVWVATSEDIAGLATYGNMK